QENAKSADSQRLYCLGVQGLLLSSLKGKVDRYTRVAKGTKSRAPIAYAIAHIPTSSSASSSSLFCKNIPEQSGTNATTSPSGRTGASSTTASSTGVVAVAVQGKVKLFCDTTLQWKCAISLSTHPSATSGASCSMISSIRCQEERLLFVDSYGGISFFEKEVLVPEVEAEAYSSTEIQASRPTTTRPAPSSQHQVGSSAVTAATTIGSVTPLFPLHHNPIGISSCVAGFGHGLYHLDTYARMLPISSPSSAPSTSGCVLSSSAASTCSTNTTPSSAALPPSFTPVSSSTAPTPRGVFSPGGRAISSASSSSCGVGVASGSSAAVKSSVTTSTVSTCASFSSCSKNSNNFNLSETTTSCTSTSTSSSGPSHKVNKSTTTTARGPMKDAKTTSTQVAAVVA
ncbi:unnamed protein product, partial [Amoebophrya sp. A25]